MREIVLDTETTGFEPEQGDRIVEIGALEIVNLRPTGQSFHVYINPERDMPDGAFGVHGIGPDLLATPRPARDGEVTLRDKPVFAAVGQKFLDFIGDAKLVIHNAAFDMKFLNFELGRMGLPTLPWDRAVDTLAIARKKFPGSPRVAGCAVPPLRDRQFIAHAARRASGQRNSCRGVSGIVGRRAARFCADIGTHQCRGRGHAGCFAQTPYPACAPADSRRGRRSRRFCRQAGGCRRLEALRLG